MMYSVEHYQPRGVTLIFAGAIAVDDAVTLAGKLFDDWRGGPAPRAPRAVDRPQVGRSLRVVAKADAPQSEVRVGHAGPPRNAPDYFDAMVMNAILGGLFSSRINLNLREKHGYTYGAFSAFEWRRGAGPFVVHTAVKSDVTGSAVKEILIEIERMRTLQRLKGQTTSTHPQLLSVRTRSPKEAAKTEASTEASSSRRTRSRSMASASRRRLPRSSRREVTISFSSEKSLRTRPMGSSVR